MYLPLSLKYRPQTFDEIIGQEHITTTLKNAISMGKLANAYLFTGPRGIGKTSTARVFAKGLNCEKGPTIKPCNKCTACQEISKGISMDVLEIDGASNRGIDEIRNLKENVKLKPFYGKYKIYIIDEVHMLTVEAFNALLKTLEEPPPHVKFIFATTKVYKVLPTIVSRCQRFDFRIIVISVIVEKLNQIVKEEKLDLEKDALFLIAKNADGSLRDAQMMLDQLISFTKGKIRSDDISRMFGTLKQEILLKISEAILNNDGPSIINLIDELINSGKDAFYIATSLIEHFRNLMVILLCKDPSSFVILAEEDRRRLEDLSHRFSIEELFYIVYTLTNALDLVAKTSLGRIPLEVALLKLSRKEKLIPVEEIMKRLSQLEESLGQDRSPKTEDRGPKPETELQTSAKRSEASPKGTNRCEAKRSLPEGDKLQTTASSFQQATYSEEALFQRLNGVWPEIIREVKKKRMSIGSYLEEGTLLGLKDKKVIVGFSESNSLHKEVLEKGNNKSIILEVLKELLDIDLSLDFVFSEEVKKCEEAMAGNGIDSSGSQRPSKKVEPIIESAVDIFNGKIVREGEGR